MVQISSSKSKGDSQVAAAFDSLANEYDSIWSLGAVGAVQREQVWMGIRLLFLPGGRVLEIGCGTGIDAVRLAQCGVFVFATDISQRMLDVARQRIELEGLGHRITLEQRSIEQLSELEDTKQFDGAFSNFGAFNCVCDLRSAAFSLSKLIRPGGKLAICLINRICLWEMVWYLIHGRPAKAFRRIRAWKGGIETSLQPDTRFRLYYPSAGNLIADFEQYFDPVSSHGIGVLVPPSCMEEMARKRKWIFDKIALLDRYIRRWPILCGLGDHRLYIFTRKNSLGQG